MIVLAFAALALWFVFAERLSPHGPQPHDVPPGTTPRQVEPGSSAAPG